MRTDRRVLSIAFGLLCCYACTGQPQPSFTMSATIEDLMEAIVEPSAATLFEIGGKLSTAAGVETIVPRDDEEWAQATHKAMAVAEVANMLKSLEPHAKEGDGVDTRVKEPEFAKNAQAMFDAAMDVRKGTDAKNPEVVFEAGGRLYEACANCHAKYLPGSLPLAQQQ